MGEKCHFCINSEYWKEMSYNWHPKNLSFKQILGFKCFHVEIKWKGLKNIIIKHIVNILICFIMYNIGESFGLDCNWVCK